MNRANLDYIVNWGQPGLYRKVLSQSIPPTKLPHKNYSWISFSVSFSLLLTVFSLPLSPSSSPLTFFSKIAFIQLYLLPTVCQAISQNMGEGRLWWEEWILLSFSCSCPGVNVESVYTSWPQRAAQQIGDAWGGKCGQRALRMKKIFLSGVNPLHPRPSKTPPAILIWQCPSSRSLEAQML